MTNHCTNRCVFCARDSAHSNGFVDLKLEREPTLGEVMADLSSYNLGIYSEIVFSGGGEPTCRLYDMLAACKWLKEKTTTPIRVNTNGHASMILDEDTAPMFKGLVDRIRISLNAADSDTYTKLCHPRFGEDTFMGVLKFAREVARYVPEVTLTALRGALSDEDLDKCAKIATDIGASFEALDRMD